MAILEIQSLTDQLINLLPDQEIVDILRDQLVSSVDLFAKINKDVDILAQMQDAFNNFIKSGQAWALGIGIVLGYMFRSFTGY